MGLRTAFLTVVLCVPLCMAVEVLAQKDPKPSPRSSDLVPDPNGYVIFCLCMGRFGNQIEHLLGGMAFAKAVNRTLLLPPFVTYRKVPFTDWFKVEPLREFHRVLPAEDFMQHLAPVVWPEEKRVAFCWLPESMKAEDKKCRMKEGSPFGPFWDSLGVDFVRDEAYHISYLEDDKWKRKYPGDKYPVLAFRGAPASFPVQPQHRSLQRHLVFTEEVTGPGDHYIKENFGKEKFVGLHLRNGIDWQKACNHVSGQERYMASPQCVMDPGKTLTKDMCLPSIEVVLSLTKKIVQQTGASFVFVATDKNPLTKELEDYMTEQNIKVYHMDPWLAWVDLYVLSKADHFIGNCVSSFSAFAKRARDVEGKPSSFWGL